MTLNASQQAVLSRADPERLTKEFSGLPRNWGKGRWLTINNRYAKNCIDNIKLDTKAGGRLRHPHLASYIAASSAIHCMDGWSCAARAMEAGLAGDTDASRHLAYYAELRAAMSLLAGIGVGVFDWKHFVVKKNRRCDGINNIGTHVFVWDALAYWARQSNTTSLILSIIQPGGKELSEWLQHFPLTAGAASRGLLAEQWLRNWGLDLQRFALDRAARNESSYRPTTISKRTYPTFNQSLSFVKNFWQANEPSLSNPFKEMDRYLLYRSLSSTFKAHHAQKKSARRVPAQFARLVEPMLHAVLPTPTDFTESQWKNFLSSKGSKFEDHVISFAEKNDPVSSPTHHFQVMARALILLRIATGANRRIISGLNASDVKKLAFWWRPIGENRGLWESGSPPAQFTDLWKDIDHALSELEKWHADGGRSKKSLFASGVEIVHSLCSCERVALWGLGI